MIVRSLIIAVTATLAGCATWGERESTVRLPSGEIYRVNCQQDGQVHFKKGDLELTVDNRGRPGIMEQALGATLLSSAGLASTAGSLLKEAK